MRIVLAHINSLPLCIWYCANPSIDMTLFHPHRNPWGTVSCCPHVLDEETEGGFATSPRLES